MVWCIYDTDCLKMKRTQGMKQLFVWYYDVIAGWLYTALPLTLWLMGLNSDAAEPKKQSLGLRPEEVHVCPLKVATNRTKCAAEKRACEGCPSSYFLPYLWLKHWVSVCSQKYVYWFLCVFMCVSESKRGNLTNVNHEGGGGEAEEVSLSRPVLLFISNYLFLQQLCLEDVKCRVQPVWRHNFPNNSYHHSFQ